MSTTSERDPITTEDVRACYVWVDNYPYEGADSPERGYDFDRWLAFHDNKLNPWPILDVRYDAAKAANLGNQLGPDERTERVQVELQNAFAAGALWQYERSPQNALILGLAVPTEES